MKPWTRGPNRRLSSNPLFEFREIPDIYVSESDSSSTSYLTSSEEASPTHSTEAVYFTSESEEREETIPMENLNQDQNQGQAQAQVPILAQNQDQNLTLRELLLPRRSAIPSCIIFPADAANFHLRNGMVQLLPTFHGMESEQAYVHIREFEEVCATFNDQNCSEDTVKLKLFSFSLKERAKTWFNSLRPRSVVSWEDLQEQFLKKFYPLYLTSNSKKGIQNFYQREGETYSQCWERYKELLNSCPHHGYEKWRVISFFYEGLVPLSRQLVESMCGGQFMNKSITEAENYLEWLSEFSLSLESDPKSINSNRAKTTPAGVYQIKESDEINAKFSTILKKIESLEANKAEQPIKSFVEQACGLCDTLGHNTDACPTLPTLREVLNADVNSLMAYKKSNGYGDTYNPSWRNHPNLSWSGNQHEGAPQKPPQQYHQNQHSHFQSGYQNQPSQFYPPSHPQPNFQPPQQHFQPQQGQPQSSYVPPHKKAPEENTQTMFQQMLQVMNQMKMSMDKLANQHDPKGKAPLPA